MFYMMYQNVTLEALKWNYIYKMYKWFIHYFKNCNNKSMLHTAKYMHQILSLSNDAYEEILKKLILWVSRKRYHLCLDK